MQSVLTVGDEFFSFLKKCDYDCIFPCCENSLWITHYLEWLKLKRNVLISNSVLNSVQPCTHFCACLFGYLQKHFKNKFNIWFSN